ncbi:MULTISPECIES: helix-turn-helix transcriptional regulator [Actinoallomurus]|jgi:transcriptional regulator with XRE-family HTH domain|nr:helix-turn-helix transcriptional regulator [Actinoallomurus sp. NBC_01490]
MALDPGPVVQRARLTAELQRLRRDAGKTQDEVARALDWSASKLIRIEGGNVRISTTDLHALLRHYGVTDEERIAELSKLARGARERGWWTLYREHLDDAYSTYLGYELGASFIRSFSPLLVPGLLQTEDYARALTIEYKPQPVAETVIEVRMQRQDKMFSREDLPQQHYVLDEAVIRRRVGGQRDQGIMPRQLAHLLELARRPDITIELIPFEKGAHFGMRGEFTVLGFEMGPPGVLYLENTQRSVTVTDSEEVAEYLEAFDHLRQLALREDETIEFIKAAAAQMKGDTAAEQMNDEDAAPVG